MKTEKSCFVIMPFKKDFNAVYRKHIKPLIETHLDSVKCVRIDESDFIGDILQHILREIRHCAFVIADVTKENANVFFEIGYAYGKNKKIILIKNKTADGLPFDIRNLKVIVYDRDKGYSGLQKNLKRIIDANIKEVKCINDKEINNIDDNDTICGKWSGKYQIQNQEYNVLLTITKDVSNKSIPYNSECIITIDGKYSVFQTLQYNKKLNQKSHSPEEWKNGEWIEFVGSSWSNLSQTIQSDYLLNAYAVNKKPINNCLWVKIWDNVNNEKINVYFDKLCD